ncbi:MAG TPA: 4-hydroxy-3-methylbut-2-enyl diphosphate reductase [Candidatus Binatia bacterium]|jgi:4-hydroxy-3-methylbut-2-enyl diphosphate reductase|nr:4-hydroxy-3-methylbut-2-enyl diphosphate reductase [Candidatus Binatia bacterium]
MAIKRVVLAQPRGFCAGVEMAIETVERALKRYGPPLYVFHEIVHNRHVVQDFVRRGVTFVQSVNEVPKGARLVFSAHGVAPGVWEEAKKKQLQVLIDATCPLVEKVHREVRRFAAQGYWIVLVGHENHDEILGTSGEAPERVRVVDSIEDALRIEVPDPEKVAVLTQTTLSVDDTREIIEILRRKFPKMLTPPKDDICYATQNRQDAVKELARDVDLLLVVGSANSENSNQLCRVARSRGITAYLINDVRDIRPTWFEGVERVGVTSGASVPERLVEEVADYFKQRGAEISNIGFVEENIHFVLPFEVAETN